MHDYDVHEALYLIFEIHSPMDRGSAPWMGPVRIYLILENLHPDFHTRQR